MPQSQFFQMQHSRHYHTLHTCNQYHQNNWLRQRGSGVYAHLKELRQLDFINHQNVGRLKIYTTTEKFQKYFGIQGDVDDLKHRLFSKVRKTASMKQTNSTPQMVTELK